MANPGKPAGLITRAETKAAKQVRIDREASLRPRHSLPMDAPARIRDSKVAAAEWRKLMRLYAELDAEIVTGLDYGLLEDYCLSIDEMGELRNMRTIAYQAWLELAQEHEEMKRQAMQDEAAYVAIKIVDAFDAIIKLDARIDRKKGLLHQLRQSLYLTPRARAAVAPKPKDKPRPADDMDQLLDEAKDPNNWIEGNE